MNTKLLFVYARHTHYLKKIAELKKAHEVFHAKTTENITINYY